MAQRAIRFSEATDKGIREAVEKGRFSSPTAFIRHAVEQELSGHREELVGAEERLAAGIEQVRQAVIPLGRAQASYVRVSGQPSEGFADVHSRAGRTGVGSSGWQSTRPTLALVKERGAGDGQRFTCSDARLG